MADLFAAAFRTGPVTVDVDGHSYTFPHLSAAGWLEKISAPNWTVEIFHLADPDAHEAFLTRVEDGTASLDDLHKVTYAVVAKVSGRTWWQAVRLASLLNEGPLLGSVLAGGADPQRLTLAAFLSVVHATLLRGAGEQDRIKIEMELSIPPAEAAGTEPEEDMSQMVSAMRSLPGISAR